MTSTPAPTDARTAEPPGTGADRTATALGDAVRRRRTATVHVDPAGRVLLYRRAASAPAHPGHYDLLADGARPRGDRSTDGPLVVRRLLTDRPPAPGPGEVDWCAFVPPAELLTDRYRPLVPDGREVLCRLLADAAAGTPPHAPRPAAHTPPPPR
ncbi:hypothetical protein KCH_18520 [Kitasatospora cheerisanensis KCTC 2395]|uniref:Nudix hydrolase domain-containing protein n=1 Tax=Kitasatospora cheerisanensis KCTC 2395 TaxID=1348663 RepID=A0A066Z777_9ACTN|nr:hypothetical protein KCH_18520 [Kitasatospora cheerisanensis KCTC 2395]